MKNDHLSKKKDFNTLNKLKLVYQEQFQNKYDFDLYIAPSEDELKKKFEFVFLEREQPYEKLFDSSLLKEVFPKSYHTIPLTLYVFLGEGREDGLFRKTLEEFTPSVRVNH